MKNYNFYVLLILLLSASCEILHAEANMLKTKDGYYIDAMEPCQDSDNKGWQMSIRNTSDQAIGGTVYLALAGYDDQKVDFEIPKGNLLVLHSCAVKDRLGMISKMSVEAAGEVLGKGMKELSEGLIPEEVTKAALNSQLGYPVCFKRIEFKYTTTLGGNAYSTRPATKTTKTYYHSFGLGGSGIACNSMNILLTVANGALVLQDESNKDLWKWTDVK